MSYQYIIPILKALPEITPEAVVATAKSPKSPLHKFFEWDDSLAAQKYRLHQARNLILSIKFENENGEAQRVFESVMIKNQRQYVAIETIESSQALVDQVIEAAFKELRYWSAKHQQYKKVFGGIFDAIDKTEDAYRRNSEKSKNGKTGKKAKGGIKGVRTGSGGIKGVRTGSGGIKARRAADQEDDGDHNHTR